jgi:MFS family permease
MAMSIAQTDEGRPSYYGWVIIAAGFVAMTISYGALYAFGVFLKPLCSEFGWTRAVTTWAFTAAIIVQHAVAMGTGDLSDRFGPRRVVLSGALCIGVSMFLASRMSQVWQFYLVYGGLFAFGIATVYSPVISTVSRWFSKRRGLATGIVVCGIGAGTMIMAPLAGWLISIYNWRLAYIIVGIIVLVTMIPASLFLRYAPRDGQFEPVEEKLAGYTLGEAIRTRAFWIYAFCWFFLAGALNVVLIHLAALATDIGIDQMIAATFLGVTGGCSIIGRLGSGFLSDKIGRERVLIFGSALMLVMLFWLLNTTTVEGFYLFAVIFGISYGSWGVALPIFTADYFGLKSAGLILGVIMFILGFGMGLAPLVAGYIFDLTSSYTYALWMAIGSAAIGVVLALLLRAPQRQAIQSEKS